MRRADIIRACESLGETMGESGVTEFFTRLHSRQDAQLEGNNAQVLRIYGELRARWYDLDETAKEIARSVGLEMLADEEFWGQVLNDIQRNNGSQSTSPELRETARRIDFFTRELSKMLNGFLQEDLPEFYSEDGQADRLKAEFGKLTIILVEDMSMASSPKRFVSAIESIDKFYEVCAKLEGSPTGDLTLVSCDSGGDKSFDFIGLAKVIDRIKGILEDIFQRTFFFKESPTSARIKMVLESLPVLDEISNLLKADKLSPEEAELLKREISHATREFMNCGLITPEFAEASIIQPRRLMTPEPRLLTKLKATAA